VKASKRILLGLLGAAAVFLAACVTATPRNDRDWYPYLARQSKVSMDQTGFAVDPVTDWTYAETGPIAQDYQNESYAFADLQNVWFVLEPQPGMSAAAHTFLLFEFSGNRLLGVTIEARREAKEDYSAFAGLFNKYELAYLWGEARDLMTRRAVMLQHETYVYPLQLEEDTKQSLLRNLLTRTQALETEPRFYNTFGSNCTNELAKAAKLKWHRSFVFTGGSAKHLFDMKVIPGMDFDSAHSQANLTAFVKTLGDAQSNPAFDAALLRELRRRQAEGL
jgi:hypothetical protein